jgi:hypothetical protein
MRQPATGARRLLSFHLGPASLPRSRFFSAPLDSHLLPLLQKGIPAHNTSSWFGGGVRGLPPRPPFLNAEWLEGLVWADVRRFLKDPGEVLERARAARG